MLATSLFGDLAATLREHHLATLAKHEHCGYFRPLAEVRSAAPPPPCRQQAPLTVRNRRVIRGPHLIRRSGSTHRSTAMSSEPHQNECSGERRYPVSGWACTGRWIPAVPRPLRSWPGAPAPPSGMSGNDWSIMRPAGCWRSVTRRYRLPAAHVPILAGPDDVRYRAFNGVEIVRAGPWLPQLVEAFRSGSAPAPLPWAPEGRAGIQPGRVPQPARVKGSSRFGHPGLPEALRLRRAQRFLAGHPVIPATVRRTSSRAATRTSSPRPCA